ncbi:virulence factor MviN [Salmonella enterica subsp. arizonae]|uniref:Virulence factor MviN n=1 Tax=Salmonella enterica subsp. arizonae TaxID=59203 RepID=A0A2X4TYM1_SALER|nr:virulence factor MviN [Salmonella enterica subsp. arizonae]
MLSTGVAERGCVRRSAKPLTVSLFQYGKFTAFDAAMTQRALIAYSVGLIGLIVVKVLAPGFYSRQDIKTPVKIAIVTLIMTQLMNLAFIGPLKHAGLSLSIGLAACLNASLLYWQLRKQNILRHNRLDVVPGASDHFRTGNGRRAVRRAAYYAGVVARGDVMAFAAFDGGSDRGDRGLFRRACRAGL